MKKDYITTLNDQDQDQTEFIEQYWENIWQEQGGVQKSDTRISRREEYRIMASFLRLLPENARLLDGGCGRGEWTIHFARSGYAVLGMDIVSATIESLQELFPDVDFMVGDIRNTGLESGSFDGVFSWGVFEHFEEGMQPCIREAYRLLKPGGFLFLSVPHDNLRHALRSVRDCKSADLNEDNMRFYQWRFTKKELSIELRLGGFDVLEVRRICKRQGILRSLYHEFGLHYDWFVTKGLSLVLQPFVPAWLVAHMVLGVAKKPDI